MHAIRLRSSLICLLTSTIFVVTGSVLLLSALAAAQDSPGRFEAGGAFSALHMRGTAGFGPALEGDVNFGSHVALEAHSAGSPQARWVTMR